MQKEQGDRYGRIDSLRGYLALGVFIHHFVITFYWKVEGDWIRPPEDFFNNLGQSSVSLFFMITGFLFTKKAIESRYLIDWKNFYLNRFFRIVPLYTFLIAIVFLIVALKTGFTLQLSVKGLIVEIAKWLLFKGEIINGYLDTRIILAGVDWTLKYEWLFYIVFPLLLVSLKYSWLVLLVVFITIVGAIFPADIKLFVWFFNSQFFILFIFGVLTAILGQYNIISYLRNRISSVIAMLALGLVLFLFPTSFGFFQSLLLVVFFIPVAFGNTLFGILDSKGAKLLGDISYSIYLLHGVVLFVVFSLIFPDCFSNINRASFMGLMVPMGGLVVLISMLTYKYIEKPCIHFGKSFYNVKFNNNKIDEVGNYEHSKQQPPL